MSIRVGSQIVAGNAARANTDLSNLTSVGQNIANWSSNVTNCITENPQDIKLELNAGTLTLKAGSKVYVPNGVGVFNVITIASDITANTTFYDNTVPSVLYYDIDSGQLLNSPTNAIRSGSTQPSTSFTSYLWYDTANNIIKRYTVNTWQPGYSLPIAICSHDSSVWTSIDQVFNGFGYIGSTVFALPGVKGLIPDGRNADGSLKNVEFTVSNVIIQANTAQSLTLDFVVRQDGVSGGISSLDWNYNEAENQIYNSVGGKATWIPCVRFVANSNSKIISFAPKTVFHAVDYNDTECMTKGALSNILNGADTKVGDVYYTSAADNTSVYAPSGGKWLVLYVAEVYISTAVLYLYSNDLYHKVGEVVSGGTQITQARSGYGAYVSLLKIA